MKQPLSSGIIINANLREWSIFNIGMEYGVHTRDNTGALTRSLPTSGSPSPPILRADLHRPTDRPGSPYAFGSQDSFFFFFFRSTRSWRVVVNFWTVAPVHYGRGMWRCAWFVPSGDLSQPVAGAEGRGRTPKSGGHWLQIVDNRGALAAKEGRDENRSGTKRAEWPFGCQGRTLWQTFPDQVGNPHKVAL